LRGSRWTVDGRIGGRGRGTPPPFRGVAAECYATGAADPRVSSTP